MMTEYYANPGSVTHAAGRDVAERVAMSLDLLASNIGALPDEIVVTSGATESNNLAILGYCLHPLQKRRKIISLVTEHKAVLDPLERMRQIGFEVLALPVLSNDSVTPGQVDLDLLEASLDTNTALVSVMMANNEIGVIQPLAQIAPMCRKYGVALHTDATQAVGSLPVDVNDLDVDLMSFSAHKFYGPKGVGGLYVRSKPRRIRLQPQIVGGGQQDNRRSGTLNSVGIIAMDLALRCCLADIAEESRNSTTGVLKLSNPRVCALRDKLYHDLLRELPFVTLNGPQLDQANRRLVGNLNCCFYPLEGQSIMLACPGLAVSSGSACTSANPAASHVLQGIGLTEDYARSSLRFGVGRFNTVAEIEQAVEWIADACQRLLKML